MDDLTARLDLAIDEAEAIILRESLAHLLTKTAIDRYSALVAVRAKIVELETHAADCDDAPWDRLDELTAEAERLLSVEAG